MCWTSATGARSLSIDRIWRTSSGWIKWVTGAEDNIWDPGWSKSMDSKIDSNMPENSRVKESFPEILQNSTTDTLDNAVVSGEPQNIEKSEKGKVLTTGKDTETQVQSGRVLQEKTVGGYPVIHLPGVQTLFCLKKITKRHMAEHLSFQNQLFQCGLFYYPCPCKFHFEV